MIWAAVITGAVGCYLVKLAGLSVPRRVLDDRRVQDVAALLPVALLAGLIVTQVFTDGRRLSLDERVVGLAVAVLAVAVRAPFLVVVVLAAGVTAGLRLLL